MRPLLLVAMMASVSTAAVAAPRAVAPGDAAWRFHCDGTDPFLIEELDEAMRSGVGYGETWDESLCNQGNMVLGEGVRIRKPKPVVTPVDPLAPVAPVDPLTGVAAPAGIAGDAAVKAAVPVVPPKKVLTPLQQKMEDQYFAIFIPVFTMFAMAVCLLIAGIGIVMIRSRKQVVVGVDCPGCRMNLPFVVGESPQLFCPRCGAACRVDIEVRGGETLAAAVPL